MPHPTDDELYDSSWRFVQWMHERVVQEARGDLLDTLDTSPKRRFWLGRLAPEASIMASPLGHRAEKLDPCSIGIRLRPAAPGPWTMHLEASFRCWDEQSNKNFAKSAPIAVALDVTLTAAGALSDNGSAAIAQQLAALGLTRRGAELRIDVEDWRDHDELVVSLVNVSDDDKNLDTHLYEAVLAVSGLNTVDFQLESLPDSFRYNRSMPAIGLNCGVDAVGGTFTTTDVIEVDKKRPRYWNAPTAQPDFSFATMASDPLPSVRALIDAAGRWGDQHWSIDALREASTGWTRPMQEEAEKARDAYGDEIARLERGYQALLNHPHLLTAFKSASAALHHSADGKYDAWRPFQIGFLVSALPGVVDPADAQTVDTVWFATGGGKTETYLGLLVTAIIHDRLTGKTSGITAWTRFPLRSLSLQQTQRFADALAGAELERRRLDAGGDPISLGFFVGQGATPNKIVKEDPISAERAVQARAQVLLRCPFCHGDQIDIRFARAAWTLDHVCLNPDCPWGSGSLPFRIVDDEIYRFLPTVIVGTLDKAASIAMQGAMRGFVGAPAGVCSLPGHGYTYSSRKATPTGCLVPDCKGTRDQLPMEPDRWPPTFRLQDELHLLRDSLGAVDAHYESLFDHLQDRLTHVRAKIVASSATLTGFERQIRVLYQRDARVFPQPGPSVDESFWSESTETPARRYVAVAPRGVTIDFVADRVLNSLQSCVRNLHDDPSAICALLGIPLEHAPHLVRQYGVDLVYGTTVRDVEASRRSAETEFPFPVNAEMLTGNTQFDELRITLDRLEHPETDFADRIHLIAASNMISHGVDIDRLNVMVMRGLPLTTAEFIQTSARVGRRWPGVVYVLHRITREREVATYAQFEKFIVQGDRFVEPIPVTRASRRVLALTMVGAEEARRLAIREYQSPKPLTTVRALRDYYRDAGITAADENDELVQALGMTGPLDELARRDIDEWTNGFFYNLNDTATQAVFPNQLSPMGMPMRSLRDVESGIPINGDD